MALDSTARESNVRDSFKKFFIDNLYTSEHVKLTFDKGLAVPKLQGDISVESWIAVLFGPMYMGNVSEMTLQIYCCTRKDKEGYQLAHLRDKVLGYLTDISQDDGVRRIPLYKSNETPWSQVGSMRVVVDMESGQMTAEDETKFKIISIRLKWGSKI